MSDSDRLSLSGDRDLTQEESLRTQLDYHVRGLGVAVRWIAENVIANEVRGFEPLPEELREPLVQELVDNPTLGWPSYDDADGYMDQFDWSTELERER